ncbi:MAG: hypothetical protein ABIR70_22160 [Bryobacteraceae bacterium]
MKWIAVTALAALSGSSAWALPTMVRLGYTNCVSCHIAPQGGGLLNSYGRGIDQAQSFRGGEYKPTKSALVRMLTIGDRTRQDVRLVSQEAASAPSTGGAWASLMRNRVFYRNATEVGKGFRVSVVALAETHSQPRPNKVYDPAQIPGTATLSSAMLQYRPKNGFEIAAGRDALPTGVYVPDFGTFLRSRNDAGLYDTPTQVKLFFWGKRYQVIPFAFGPSGQSGSRRETGGGGLAEFDVLGKGKTILGITGLHGTTTLSDRRLLGGYARLGFGRWGILAEHDVTDRTMNATAIAFRQHASYLQGFWAAREWLVASVIGEQLAVARPYREDLRAGKIEVAARMSSGLTLSANVRMQYNRITGVWAPSASLQIALKPVY